MKINIYYGGRGLLDDPTLYVINKMQSVLEELNVNPKGDEYVLLIFFFFRNMSFGWCL